MGVKNGFLTSEFWISLLVQVVSIAALTGLISPDDADKWQQVAVQLGGLLAMVVSAAYYNKTRTKIKVTASECQCLEEGQPVDLVEVSSPTTNTQRRAQAKANREELKKTLSKSPPGTLIVEEGREYREK